MSGLLALLDDVAAIAKVAAASVDDIAGQAAQAGAKTAGALIDDAAVTPAYVQGFSPSRELPIVGRIALGSIRNKLLILLPVAMLLSSFAPQAITPLLMLGGLYLSFEGAEKVWHAVFGGGHAAEGAGAGDPAHLEKEKVAGAIKTDFILSAEIMTIALAAIPKSTLWIEAATLALVGVGVTLAVYGSVALIVKLDDIGLAMGRHGRLALTRRLGCALVRNIAPFLTLLMVVGTAAMLWVGGSIVLHGAHDLGLAAPYEAVHHWAEAAVGLLGEGAGAGLRAALIWAGEAALFALAALIIGICLMPLAKWVMTPLWRAVFRGRA